jgi:hypothetical protein
MVDFKHVSLCRMARVALHVMALLGCLLSTQGVGLAVCGVVLGVDTRHVVRASSAGDHWVRMLVSHRQGLGVKAQHPQRCGAERALNLFSDPSSQQSETHVLTFASLDSAAETEGTALWGDGWQLGFFGAMESGWLPVWQSPVFHEVTVGSEGVEIFANWIRSRQAKPVLRC